MANLYTPTQLNVTQPNGGFQQGGWYSGRQYWDGTLSDPGVIHPSSNQQGSGQLVSPQVNAQSAVQQGVSAQQLEGYLQQQRDQSAQVVPTSTVNTQQPGTVAGTGTGTGAGIGYTAPATIDLPSLYASKYAEAGIADLQTKYSDMKKAFIDAKAKNNDNPFLSEGSRVGREAKMQKQFDERTTNILNDIAMKKADVEMQINLATKQYDINTEASKTAFAQFNSLLDSGALNNASGQDIANITRSTGISSSMIQSAISAKKSKDIQTQTISYDDGTNQGFAIINQQTGEIIKKQVIAQSKPTATTTAQTKEDAVNMVKSASQAGESFSDIMATMSYSGLTPQEIYNIYNSTSKWGAVQIGTGTPDDIANSRFTKEQLQGMGISFPSD